MTAAKRNSSLIPTRKWFATQVTALAGWAIALINVGHWTATIKITLVTIIAQALIGWLVPNDLTPAGVPLRRPRRRKRERGYAGVNLIGVVLLLIVIVLLFNVTHGLSLLLLILILALLFL